MCAPAELLDNYNLNKLDVPAIYSSMFTNSKSLKEPSGLVPRFVAALAEAVHFIEMNPNRGKADLSKVRSINDQDVLQSAYDAYAKPLVNRRMVAAGECRFHGGRDCALRWHANQKTTSGDH